MNKVIQRDGKEQLVKREEPRRKRRVAKLWKVMRKIVTDTLLFLGVLFMDCPKQARER